jgi:hypothetical protein
VLKFSLIATPKLVMPAGDEVLAETAARHTASTNTGAANFRIGGFYLRARTDRVIE